MKKDSDDAKSKHAKSNEKHARAVAFRAKWLEESEGKTRGDWDPKKHMKAMEQKYEIQWETEPEQPSLMRFVQRRVAKKPEDSEPKVETLAKRGSIEVEFLLCVTPQEKFSHKHTCDVRTSFMDNLAEIDSPLKLRTSGTYYSIYNDLTIF